MFTLSLYQFNALDSSSKVTEILENGRLIDDRIADGHKVLLYQLHSFFVEIGIKDDAAEFDFIKPYSTFDAMKNFFDPAND